MMQVNLPTALKKIRRKSKDYREVDILEAYREMIAQDGQMEGELKSALSSVPSGEAPRLDASQLDEEHVFHLAHIKELATTYRLRFLDAHLFKGEIPDEALSKLKAVQRRQSKDLTHFKIMAPAELFKLSYQDKDPMLFVPIGKNLYYLVHQWGNDMSMWRKLLVYPFRNVGTLIRTMLIVAFVFQMAIPTSIMNGGFEGQSLTIRIWMTLHTFIALAGMIALFGYPSLKNFNSVLWNSKYSD
ncbi:MAG: hypothetical protein HWD92_09425 [Flavobacteriia bacterium]|nr:hypothetical protein [Flavobacteriia bacterium]